MQPQHYDHHFEQIIGKAHEIQNGAHEKLHAENKLTSDLRRPYRIRQSQIKDASFFPPSKNPVEETEES